VSEVGLNFGAKFEGRNARSHKSTMFNEVYMYITLLLMQIYRFVISPGAENVKCPGDRVLTVLLTYIVLIHI
jgi:hypothetical protein